MDAIKAKLRKMSSREIEEKIKKGSLTGESRDAAIEVLNERSFDTSHLVSEEQAVAEAEGTAQVGEETNDQPQPDQQGEAEAPKVKKAVAKKEPKPKAEKAEKVKKEKVAKEKKPRETKAKGGFPEFGKRVRFTSHKTSPVMPSTELEGVIQSVVKGSKNKERSYFNIKTEHGVFQKAEGSFTFIEE